MKPVVRDAIVQCLRQGGRTQRQIAEETGLELPQINGCLLRMRQGGMAHRSHYIEQPGSGAPPAVWILGAGIDAPRPRVKDPAQARRQAQTRFRRKHRARLRLKDRQRRGSDTMYAQLRSKR